MKFFNLLFGCMLVVFPLTSSALGARNPQSLNDAISFNDMANLKSLLAGGADPNNPTPPAGVTPLQTVVIGIEIYHQFRSTDPADLVRYQSRLEMARLLLQAGADPDLQLGHRPSARNGALQLQRQYGDSTLVQLFNRYPQKRNPSAPSRADERPQAGEGSWVGYAVTRTGRSGNPTNVGSLHFGAAWGASSEQEAKLEAARYCQKEGGTCEADSSSTTAWQSQCIAVAKGRFTMTHSGFGTTYRIVNAYPSLRAHDTLSSAKREALNDCRVSLQDSRSSCRIVIGGCAR